MYSRMRRFDLLEAVVVLVEDAPRLADVEPVGGALGPRQIDEPLDVGARDLELGAGGVHRAHALELLAGRLLGVGGELGAGDALAEHLDVVLVDVDLAELSADALHLLAQEELALAARHLLLDHGRDLLLDPVDLALAVDQVEHPADAGAHLQGLQHRLLGVVADRQVARHQVGEGPRLAHVVQDARGLPALAREQVAEGARGGAEVGGQSVDLDIDHGLLVDALDARAERGAAAEGLQDLHAADALEHDRVIARAQPDDLEHAGDRPEGVDLVEGRVLRLGLLLGDDADERAVPAGDLLDQANRSGAAHVDGHDRRGEEHRVAQRQDRKDRLGLGREERITHGFRYDRRVRGPSQSRGFARNCP